jgi:hypothetical protein
LTGRPPASTLRAIVVAFARQFRTLHGLSLTARPQFDGFYVVAQFRSRQARSWSIRAITEVSIPEGYSHLRRQSRSTSTSQSVSYRQSRT